MGCAEIMCPLDNFGVRGPCLDVVIANPQGVIEAGASLGLEYPAPKPIKALIDTGAGVTVVSRTFARHCKLFQTYDGAVIRSLGATHRGGEHAASVSFPGTTLKPFSTMRVVSADFKQEPYHACLIGRDILRNWNIQFDARTGKLTIVDG